MGDRVDGGDQGRVGPDAQARARLLSLARDEATTSLIAAALGAPPQDRAELLVAALQLVPAMHTEGELLEARLLAEARDAGLTWARIAEAMGLKSPQAAQQLAARRASLLG